MFLDAEASQGPALSLTLSLLAALKLGDPYQNLTQSWMVPHGT